jgi:hypothetical protein
VNASLEVVKSPNFRNADNTVRCTIHGATIIRMRALMNFEERDGWSFHILAEDQRTLLISDCTVGKKENLLSIITRLHGDVAEAKFVVRWENRGNVWIDISEAQIEALRAYKRRHSRATTERVPAENAPRYPPHS